MDLLGDLDALAERAEKHPLSTVRWTPPQLALHQCTKRFKLLRTGVQAGKTWAGAGEAIWICLGRHPYRNVRAGPVEAWVLCRSWSQSVAIQKKIWELAPKDEVAPETRFDAKNGFVGVQKALVFRNGSILRVKTAGQDSLNLESATIHHVWIDEPLGDEHVWGALVSRLRRTGGTVTITMTPAVSSGDLDWLRKLVEAGQVEDLHYRMEAANYIPEGATKPLLTEDGVPMDEAWIEEQVATTLPWQRGVRCHGEWEYASTDKAFQAFDRNKHVVDDVAGSGILPAKVQVCLGIDYGEEALRTVGVLCYVDASEEHPRIYAVGEYAPREASTVEMDIDGILEMLTSCGDRWSDLDFAWADKKYEGPTTAKNARVYEAALAKRLKLAGEVRPQIRVAKRGLKRDHKWPSVRWLHEAMIRPGHFVVDSSLSWLIESLERWDGTEKHPGKDACDALLYSLRHLWGPMPGAPGRVLRRRF